MQIISWKDILEFWFAPEHVPLHFAQSEVFDNKIRNKFLTTWEIGTEGLLVGWRTELRGRLAEIIVLDQFSRNLWRNDARTYAQDKMSVVLAQEAVAHPEYDALSKAEKKFMLLPFMHSESLELHDLAYTYFEALGDDGTLRFEKLHRNVLAKYGRYPFRNEALGRESTPDELDYLEKRLEGTLNKSLY